MRILRNIFGKPRVQVRPYHYIPNFEILIEIGQIREVFRWVFSDDQKTSKDCANAIHRILSSRKAVKNKSLYISLSGIRLKKQDLSKFFEFEPDVQNSLFSVASMNGNGYVREEALTFLINNPNQTTFPFVLFRLADWVPKIRKIASKGVRGVMQILDHQYLIEHYKNIDWLLTVKRANLESIHQAVTDFIFLKKNVDHILHDIDRYDFGARYFIFRNLIARNKLDGKVSDQLLTDKHSLIRILAIRNIDLVDRPEILKRLLRDRSQKIRHYAIQKIPETSLGSFRYELESLLFDSSAAIRVITRTLLSNVSKQNYPIVYRAEVAKNPTKGSIVGLSEVGDMSDLEIFSAFLNSEFANQRAAGLYAISNLDFGKAKTIAFDLLSDDSNAVKKICSFIITRERSFLDLTTLRSIYKNGSNETKRYVLKMLSKYGGWSIAGDFLKGIDEADQKVKQTAIALFNSWHNYSVRLGKVQTEAEKAYVMGVYKKINFKSIELPRDVVKQIEEIPFIFG